MPALNRLQVSEKTCSDRSVRPSRSRISASTALRIEPLHEEPVSALCLQVVALPHVVLANITHRRQRKTSAVRSGDRNQNKQLLPRLVPRERDSVQQCSIAVNVNTW